MYNKVEIKKEEELKENDKIEEKTINKEDENIV